MTTDNDLRRRRRAPGEIDECLTYSVEQAAKVIGISRAHAYEAVRTGELPSIRIGQRILVPRAALLRLVGS